MWKFLLLFFIVVSCKKDNVALIKEHVKIIDCTISGRIVDCNNNPITNGKVFISYEQNNTYYTNAPNGVFAIKLLKKADTNSNTIIAIDKNTLLQSTAVKVTIKSPLVNVGDIKACNANAEEFVKVEVDGNPFNWVSNLNNDSVVGISFNNPIPYYNTWKTRTEVTGQITNPSININSFARLWIDHNYQIGNVYQAGMHFENPYYYPNRNFGFVRDTSNKAELLEAGNNYEGFISGKFRNAKLAFSNGVTRTANGSFRVRRIDE